VESAHQVCRCAGAETPSTASKYPTRFSLAARCCYGVTTGVSRLFRTFSPWPFAHCHIFHSGLCHLILETNKHMVKCQTFPYTIIVAALYIICILNWSATDRESNLILSLTSPFIYQGNSFASSPLSNSSQKSNILSSAHDSARRLHSRSN
jgi:hypothetical protein